MCFFCVSSFTFCLALTFFRTREREKATSFHRLKVTALSTCAMLPRERRLVQDINRQPWTYSYLEPEADIRSFSESLGKDSKDRDLYRDSRVTKVVDKEFNNGRTAWHVALSVLSFMLGMKLNSASFY
jgi:hypothetical protein